MINLLLSVAYQGCTEKCHHKEYYCFRNHFKYAQESDPVSETSNNRLLRCYKVPS